MTFDFKESTVRLRLQILQGLVDLAASDRRPEASKDYRTRAEQLLVELGKADQTIGMLTPRPTFPYAGCESAIDAVIEYLKDSGRAQTEAQIRRGALEGGFRGAKEGTELRLHKTIDAHLKAWRGGIKNPGEMGRKIKEIDGLIGLYEWDSSRFASLI